MYKKITALCFIVLIQSCQSIVYPLIPSETQKPIVIIKNSNPNLKAESVTLPINKLGIPITSGYEELKNILASVKLSDGSVENDVEWVISDNQIASIDELGKITGLKEGTVTITAQSRRDKTKSASFQLIVYSYNFVPKFSPQGDKIAFISNRDGKDNLYTMNADGSEQKKISSNPLIGQDFQWSPQGEKIVARVGGLSIFESGNKDKLLKTNSINENSFMWSPDNSKIAFIGSPLNSNGSNVVELYLINSDGSNLTKVSDNVRQMPNLSTFIWSPDSTKIAYLSRTINSSSNLILSKNNLNIFDIALNKSAYIAQSTDFCWLPDSTKLIYTDALPELVNPNVDTAAPIFKINADGTGKEIFLENDLAYSKMALSPDNTKIAVIGSKLINSNSGGKLQDIFVLSPDGKEIKNITNNQFGAMTMPPLPPNPLSTIFKYPKIVYESTPVWSFDNKTLTMNIKSNIQFNGLGSYNINTIFIDTGKVTEHNISGQHSISRYSEITWSTNGKQIVFASNRDTNKNQDNVFNNEIYSLDINNSQITKLTTNNESNTK